jgi:subtilisin family serine protease
MARTHILVELGQGVDETRFLERARGQGLRRLGRVYGTRWLTMAIPAGAAPRAAAAAARGLAGVVRSSPDLLIQAYHHTGPVSPPYVRDPLYIYDDDPTTKPDCDPCTAAQIVDQWGLFRVDAESGWDIETGGMTSDDDEVVIAIIDSGMDLDHDDLRDNLWFNPKELPDGLDNDGNGFVDDLHGADFVGEGVGSPLDDPASQDANPDIPDHGTWIEDWDAPWLWRFDGDPATGDAMDNNGDFIVDLGVFHGTFVAGIAAAATDNVNPETLLYEGIAGACWNCKLMPVRMIDAEGSGLMSNAAAAIRYAADNGADIINASWGVDTNGLDPADVEIVRQAVDYAVGRGVIVVAATGNAGTPGLSFPAAMANTIAVGSSDWTDAWSAFSSYGYSAETPDDGIDNDGNGWVDDTVDVVAPGEAMWSTTVISPYDAFILNGWDWYCCAENPGPDDWYPGEDAYTRSDGTSFATPLVAGHIGVLLSANCGADLDDVRQAIRASALDVGLPGYDARTGFGRRCADRLRPPAIRGAHEYRLRELWRVRRQRGAERERRRGSADCRPGQARRGGDSRRERLVRLRRRHHRLRVARKRSPHRDRGDADADARHRGARHRADGDRQRRRRQFRLRAGGAMQEELRRRRDAGSAGCRG